MIQNHFADYTTLALPLALIHNKFSMQISDEFCRFMEHPESLVFPLLFLFINKRPRERVYVTKSSGSWLETKTENRMRKDKIECASGLMRSATAITTCHFCTAPISKKVLLLLLFIDGYFSLKFNDARL